MSEAQAGVESVMELFSDHGELEVDLITSLGKFEAHTMRTRESLSEIGHVTLEVASALNIAFDEALESDATVVLRVGAIEKRHWSLVLGKVDFLGMDGGMLRYRLELYPRFWLLGFTKDVRKWRDETTEKIIDSVLDRYGVAHRWDTTRACASRPYTVQYRESALDFVSRLLEFEGIYYSFEEDGTMVLADRSASSPEVSELPYELLDTEGALAHDAVGVTSVRRGVRTGSGRATVNDYNWKTPSTTLLSSSRGDRDQELEVYDYPTGYRDPAAGAMLARLRLEALQAKKKFIEGTSTVPLFAPARSFQFLHEEGLSFTGSYVLTSVEHKFDRRDPARKRPHSQYENTFFAIPEDVPFRPELKTPRPVVEGNHTVMVRGPVGEEIHTDVYGRLKAQFHWDREATGTDADSRWLRMNQEVSTSLVLGRVGWEVSVAYVDGDPERPFGFARLMNGEMMPSYSQPARKNVMTIKTETYPGKGGFNEIRLDDSAGTMRMDFRAERDMTNYVTNNKTETIAIDQHREVKQNRSHQVRGNQKVTIGSNSVTKIGDTTSPTVKGTRTDSVGGNEKIKVGSMAQQMVRNDDVESVGGTRTSIVGGVNLPSLDAGAIAKGVAANAASAVGTALGGELGGAIAGGAVNGGAQGAMDALRGGAQSRLSQAADQLVTKSSTPLGSLSGPPPVPGSSSPGPDVAGGAPASLGGGAPDVVGALQSAIPSPESILSQATGGLSDIKSVSDLTNLLKGTISRRSEKLYNRLVGGAQVQIAGGPIGHKAGKVLAETAGGVKATITATGGIEKSITGYMLSLVGGLALRKAKNDVNVASDNSNVTVGSSASFDAKETMELRGKVIELEAAEHFILQSGSVTIEMKPEGTSIKGTMKFDAQGKIKVGGGPDDLAGG